ncbi:uncharacterized protein LOC122919362 isoform X2 [Bufo gargarizans]|nr:uncharacterized protein LOC122919362 isoform X2 [Bufo gargarizans]XP_044124274.1 uncharacterized protein LOC122919362 isoform X2 [Bufo gargarizans]
MDSYQDLWGDDNMPDAQLLMAVDDYYASYISGGGAQLFSDDSPSMGLVHTYISSEPDYNPTSPCLPDTQIRDILGIATRDVDTENTVHSNIEVTSNNNSAELKENDPSRVIDLTTPGRPEMKQTTRLARTPLERKVYTIDDIATLSEEALQKQRKRGKQPLKRKMATTGGSKTESKKANTKVFQLPGSSARTNRTVSFPEPPEAITNARDSWLAENTAMPVIRCPDAPKRKQNNKARIAKERQRSTTKQHQEQFSPIAGVLTTPLPGLQSGEPTSVINDITALCDITPAPNTQDVVPCKKRITFDTPDTCSNVQQISEPQQRDAPLVHSCYCRGGKTLRDIAKCNDKMARVALHLKCYVKDSTSLAFNSPNKNTEGQIHATRDKCIRLITHLDALEKELLRRD